MQLLTRFLISVALVGQLAQAQVAWIDKPVARWTDSDARLVLSESPWSKQVEPILKSEGPRGGRGVGIGSPLGTIGIGGGGIGIGGPRRGGRSGRGPGGGMPPVGMPGGGGRPMADEIAPRTISPVTIRWESALPVQEAELKTADGNAPIVDEANYALAIVGLPNRLANGDPQALAKQWKGQAKLKRSGKEDIKPSEVRVLPRDEGLVVMFLFSRTNEITASDREVEFEAVIGPLELKQIFTLREMSYAGKLEL